MLSFEVLTCGYELEQYELKQIQSDMESYLENQMEEQFKEHYLNKRKNGVA